MLLQSLKTQLPPPRPPFHPSLPIAARAADPSRSRAISCPSSKAAGCEQRVFLPCSPEMGEGGQSFPFVEESEEKDGAYAPQVSSFHTAILQSGKNSSLSSSSSPQIFPAVSGAAAVPTRIFPFCLSPASALVQSHLPGFLCLA